MISNGFGFCYMLNVCVLSRDLSPVVEIWSILPGMFRTLDKKKYKEKGKKSSVSQMRGKIVCLFHKKVNKEFNK